MPVVGSADGMDIEEAGGIFSGCDPDLDIPSVGYASA
jgi:hypothetical protein